MSDLSSIERLKFEALFDMESGYVLDFSNNTFSVFTIENVSIDIFDSKYEYGSNSKANRLRKFWLEESNEVVGKLLSALLDYWLMKKQTSEAEFSSKEKTLYDECQKIVNRLNQDSFRQIQENTSSPLQKRRIFISYRRIDSAGYAGRIYDRLVARFGENAIFMDVDTIEGGVDFIKVLEDAVQSCDVLIALIGRQWLSITDKDGKRRLDSPEDFVRIEIAVALKRNIRVIPVLVDGVDMPQLAELPENLKVLVRRNALQVNHHSFNPDVYRLVEQTKLALDEAEESRVMKTQALQVEHEKAGEEKADRFQVIYLYLVPILILLVTLAIVIPLSVNLYNKFPELTWALKNTPTATVDLSLAPQLNFSSTETFIPAISESLIPTETPTPTFTLTPTIASTFTLTATTIPTRTSTLKPTATHTFSPTPVIILDRRQIPMVLVSAGFFQMYSKKSTIKTYLNSFYIDQHEVTNAQYKECVETKACATPYFDQAGSQFSNVEHYTNRDYDNFPVVLVSWNMADNYCKWRDKNSHLPTNAEWEKAARGSLVNMPYPWGDALPVCNEGYLNGANFSQCGSSANANDAFPVKQFLPNGYGLFDMAGNVGEWVDGSGDVSRIKYLIRGGSWLEDANQLRFEFISSNDPSCSTPADCGYVATGFRCARDTNP